jgi:hypothetical protein
MTGTDGKSPMRSSLWIAAALLGASFALQSTASNGQEIGKSHKRKAPMKAARERFRMVAVSTRES